MKDFRLYDISDFVMDEDFIRWVHEQREEDNLFWTNWLQQNPDKHLVIAEARLVVESLQLQQITIEEKEVEHEVNKLLQTISAQHTPRQQRHRLLTITMKYAWQTAAVALLLCTTAILYVLTRGKATHPFVYASMTAHRNLIEQTNTSSKPELITLPDGSRVNLLPKSRISYPQNIDTASFRDVYLLGEAFFQVTRNVHRPFRVYANEIVTKVLGTSFTIRSFEKDTAIQVIVRTGKVSVYAQTQISGSGKTPEIIITPNQQLVYEKAAQKFQKELLGNPLVIAPGALENSMAYDDAPLEKVFNDLSKAYGINIVCDSEAMEKCTVTADLKGESFYQRLDLICKAIGGKYELIDGQVVIESAGCK
jgi:ferric-dicitrate binding protein FerR (iron transport regulator)